VFFFVIFYLKIKKSERNQLCVCVWRSGGWACGRGMTTNTAGPETIFFIKGKQFFSFKNGDYGLNVWITETKTKKFKCRGKGSNCLPRIEPA